MILRRTAALLALALAATSCGGGSRGPGVTPVTPPGSGTISPAALATIPEVASSNGVASLTLQAKLDADSRPSFFWNGQEVAPTIRVQPGDTIQLTFQNMLPQFCAVDVVSNANLHFHGFNSSPTPPGDEVVSTNAAPGATYTYSVTVNPDQPPGLYWYHTHAHGLASWEVGNGEAGAIVVEGIANYVPQTAGLRERVIILRDVPTSATYAAGEDSVLRRSARSARRPLDDDGGGNACAPETDATPTINGAPMASIGIKPGETELFRVLNASGHRHFDLSVDGATLTVVAQDGVPIDTYPGAPQTLSVSDVVIPPAGRVEFLVTGAATPRALVSNCYKSGPAGDTDPQIALGVLTDDTNWPQPSTATTETRVRKRIAGLRFSQFYHTTMPAPAAERLFHFQEDANGFYINGAAYSAAAAPEAGSQSGTTEEWTLENDTQEVHAFHIHQAHFIVESINGVNEPNEHWVDTVDIPPEGVGVQGQLIPSLTKVLIDLRDPTIRGTFVFHCHILDHEDGGMMAKITVQ